MALGDLNAIYEIDHLSASPWSYRQLADELSLSSSRQLVCRPPGSSAIAGFLIARIIPPEAEILRLATAAALRRQGVASRLLDSFIDMSRRAGVLAIHLELRAANAPALALYQKFAFEMTGRRPNYYTGPNDDALCMTFSFSGHETPPGAN